MAVGDGDTMTAERRRQRSRTRRRNGSIELEVFDRDARRCQLPRQPPFAIGRQEDHALAAGRLKSFGEIDDDTFGATGAVGLDQLSDPEHWEFSRAEPGAR